jgi:branched-chain amino acid transport system substrate-binding protein
MEIRSSDWLIDGLYADSSFEDSPEFLNNLVDDCPSFVADILVSELGIPQEAALCIGENTTGDTYGLFAQSVITPSDEISEEIQAALIEFLDIADGCGIDLLNTPGPSSQEPFTYGDDPALDALWESCLNGSASGNREACSDLFYEAPIDSEYEAFGGCLDQIWGEWDTTLGECKAAPITYGDNPVLDALWESCLNGDKDICTDLYFAAPYDSDYAELGNCLNEIWGEWDTTLGECNDPFTYGDSPVLDALWESCVNRDAATTDQYMNACDELFWESPYDSDYATLGDCLLSEAREWDFESNECIFPDPLNIGTLLPETGALAFLSEPLVLAVDMAIRDINWSGGVNGADVILTKGDSGTDPDIANTTVDRLLTEQVDAIVGAAASGITGSVIAKITSAGVTECSPSNTAAGLGTAGDNGYYFRTAPSDDLQAPALADTVLYDGYTNVAIVSRADDYGVGFNAYFEPAVASGGGTIVYSEPYPPEATSFDDVVADVIASGPDAVVIVAFEEGVQIIQTMIEQGAGPDVIQIYITDGMATGRLGELIDPNNPGIAEGIKGSQPSAAPISGAAFFPDAFADFAPGVSTIFSAHSYDCAILIALAAEAAGSNDSADIAAQMVAVSRDGEPCSTFAECKDLLAIGADIDYEGASGYIDFLDVGEPSVGNYDIYEYDADGVQQVYEELTFGP